MDKGKAVKMTITPDMARKMLAEAHHNRTIRSALLSRLVRDIKTGNWRITGETIIFDDEGKLTDGQHRLKACIEAGIPITTYVVLGGIDFDAMLFTDTGTARTPGDALYIMGHSEGNTLAAMCRWIRRYETGSMAYRVATISRTELLEIIEKEKDLRLSISYGRRVIKFMTLSLGSALHFLMAKKDRETANAFFNELAAGSNDLTSPVVVLREKFIRSGQRAAKHPEHYVAAWTIKAWNLYRKGKTTKIINWYPESPNRPEVFPVIE